MLKILNSYCSILLAIFSLVLYSCEKQDFSDSESLGLIESSLLINKIENRYVNSRFNSEFCDRGRYDQVIRGGNASELYFSEAGVIFNNPQFIGQLSTIFIGTYDELPETINSTTTSNYRLADNYIENGGNVSEELYLKVRLVLGDNIYSTIVDNYYVDGFDKIDNERQDKIKFTLLSDEDKICPSSDKLLVKAEWSYEGHMYNENDLSDSIMVEGLKAVIYNNGF